MEYAFSIHAGPAASAADIIGRAGPRAPHATSTTGGRMLTGAEREAFALRVMKEVRRWPGVEMRTHVNPLAEDSDDGIEFRLYGRQVGHIHHDCSVHLSLTRALKESVVEQGLALPLVQAGSPSWIAFAPEVADDVNRAIWLLRLNYVRLRRQRLSPDAAASSELLREHEGALGELTPSMATVLQRTQARAPRPLPPVA
jgi:hypothetical protein